MFSKVCIAIFVAFVVGTSCQQIRVARSPDRMEIVMPHNSSNAPDNSGKLEREGEYWQGEGDQHEPEDRNNDDDLDNFEKDMEYHHEQNDKNTDEMEENFEEDREALHDQHEANDEHNSEHHNNMNDDGNDSQPEDFSKEMHQHGDHYGEQGEEDRSSMEHAMNNSDYEEPSFTYEWD